MTFVSPSDGHFGCLTTVIILCAHTALNGFLSVDLKVLYKRNSDVFLVPQLVEPVSNRINNRIQSCEFWSNALSITQFGHFRVFQLEIRSCEGTGLLSLVNCL